MIILSLACFAAGLAGWVAWRRVLSCDDVRVHPRSEPGNPEATITSIIIPARNEEKNLPRLLRSLAPRNPQLIECIVVDDGSTDRTADLARSHGATLIHSSSLPEGWTGKTWACWQGAQASMGQNLVFLDADTWFETDGFAKIQEQFLRLGPKHALSILPYHRVFSPYEELSAFFNILMAMGTCGAGRLTGQSLWISRNDYFSAGGHSSVSAQILENFFFTGALNRAGVKTSSLIGKSSLSMRMYPEGFAQLRDGWVKASSHGSSGSPRWLLLATAAWIAGLIGSALGASCFFGPFTVAYFFFAVQTGFFLRKLGSYSPWTALAYPVPLLVYFLIFCQSHRMKGKNMSATWKGREVPSSR